jgi:hypothetical protein
MVGILIFYFFEVKMKFVVDEMLISFTDAQYEFENLEKAVEFARGLSLESNNVISISPFDDEDSVYLFMGGICYKPYNPHKLELVR